MVMMPPTRVLVVGCGSIGRRHARLGAIENAAMLGVEFAHEALGHPSAPLRRPTDTSGEERRPRARRTLQCVKERDTRR